MVLWLAVSDNKTPICTHCVSMTTTECCLSGFEQRCYLASRETANLYNQESLPALPFRTNAPITHTPLNPPDMQRHMFRMKTGIGIRREFTRSAESCGVRICPLVRSDLKLPFFWLLERYPALPIYVASWFASQYGCLRAWTERNRSFEIGVNRISGCLG
jgi:hypothetical protein